MISLLLAAALIQGAPTSHSAQCLNEVAAMTGERLNITDPAFLQAAIRKTDVLMARTSEAIQAAEELKVAQADVLAELPAKIASGELPVGSDVLFREQAEREMANFQSLLDAQKRSAPSCDWPAAPRSALAPAN